MAPIRLTADDWAYRFAIELLRLGVRADPDDLHAMGLELHATLSHLMPEQAAQAEFREWPPHDD